MQVTADKIATTACYLLGSKSAFPAICVAPNTETQPCPIMCVIMLYVKDRGKIHIGSRIITIIGIQ
jgi:hypothetical protein